jgi:hypothetical protein
MRHLVLALMIALLPLRGWVGDAMATQMASSSIAIESRAARAHEMAATASFDHQNQAIETAHALPDCHGQLLASPRLIRPQATTTAELAKPARLATRWRCRPHRLK